MRHAAILLACLMLLGCTVHDPIPQPDPRRMRCYSGSLLMIDTMVLAFNPEPTGNVVFTLTYADSMWDVRQQRYVSTKNMACIYGDDNIQRFPGSLPWLLYDATEQSTIPFNREE